LTKWYSPGTVRLVLPRLLVQAATNDHVTESALVNTTYLNAIPNAASGEPGMPRLLGFGLLAAALFSVTFVLNRSMSLSGGHWAWSAALRYVDMACLMARAIQFCRSGLGVSGGVVT